VLGTISKLTGGQPHVIIEYIKYGFGKGNLENSAYYYGAQLSSQHNIE